MIEVEKKIMLSDANKGDLIEDAKFLGKYFFTDIYYDTIFFSLTIKDKWLRSRDGKFELKIPAYINNEQSINQYEEIKDELMIKKILNLPQNINIKDGLISKNYHSLCRLNTTREKYIKDQFSIDIDNVKSKNFSYAIAEIELMVEKKSEIKRALYKITSFIKSNRISDMPARGKVIEYLRQKNLTHYNVLVSARVIKD